MQHSFERRGQRLRVLGRHEDAAPPPSVAGKPSTLIPITGTPWASPMIAVCEKASSRDGIASTVTLAMYGPGSAT